ncbi:MAG: hypothetical protein II608_00885, partial [Oscillospiraceae bacterium]|nr:hypothetical protein [Oscillospiraceae bacterium]
MKDTSSSGRFPFEHIPLIVVLPQNQRRIAEKRMNCIFIIIDICQPCDSRDFLSGIFAGGATVV